MSAVAKAEPAAAVSGAELLGLILRLHDREPDAALLRGLRAERPDALFAAALPDPEGQAAAAAFGRMIAALPAVPGAAFLDALAADYADIYLTHGYRIAPCGSVWMTEEHLERQQPMFEVRGWYEHYGLSVPDWRTRADDHLVHELQFVEHLLALGAAAAARDAARFLDRHVLPWVPEFCDRTAARAREPYFVASALLTRAFLSGLRDALEAVTGEARQVVPHAWAREAERAARAAEAEAERPFLPGCGEGW